jgi:hypothetical protein
MSRFEIVLVSIITAAVVCLMAALLVMARQAHAHDPVYSNSIVVFPDPYSGKRDPQTGLLCCGGEDCETLKVMPGMLTPGDDGIRLKLTEEQARVINPNRIGPVDTVIPLNRIQPTPPEWSGEYRVCIPSRNEPAVRPRDFFCFWAPPST